MLKGKELYDAWDAAIKEVDVLEMRRLLDISTQLIDQGIIHYRGNGTIFTTLPLNMVNKNLEATKLLVDVGADINQHGQGNVLALHDASPEVANYLIAHGANVNKIGYEDFSPLMYEVYMHNYENIDMMIKSGADVNYQNPRDGCSSLHWAAKKGDLKIVKLLVAHGALPGLLNHNQQTPEFLAKEHDRIEVHEYLATVSRELDK